MGVSYLMEITEKLLLAVCRIIIAEKHDSYGIREMGYLSTSALCVETDPSHD